MKMLGKPKKIALGTLMALSATTAMANNPTAHLGEWEKTCKDGGYYIHIESHKKTYGTGSKTTPYFNKVIIDKAELRYVPSEDDTQGPPHDSKIVRHVFSPQERGEAIDACLTSRKDLADDLESAANYNVETGWGRWYHGTSNPNDLRNPAKGFIDDYQYAVRKTWAGKVIKETYNNGTMDYGFRVLEGRDLLDLPEWLDSIPEKDWKK